METISAQAIRQSNELRELLRTGALPRLGLVDVGKGSRLRFELAVRATLNDLARFAARADGGREVGAERWRQLARDLERLHHVALTARGAGVRE